MAGNQLGQFFTVTSWGESHGKAIGCVVDGVPPNIALSEHDIQPFLDQRKPGTSRFVTQRKESDSVEILSGTFEGKTTGTPISLIIYNEDARSKDYSDIKDKFRPGHADYTYHTKYGIRDYRGGGRSSARETAVRVASGAIARKILETQFASDNIKKYGLNRCHESFSITSAVTQIGPHKIQSNDWDHDFISQNPFFSPCAKAVPVWEKFLDETRKQGSSTGAIVEVRTKGLPAGLGEPVYDRLDADLAKAMMSINAVKGVEIGSGFEVAHLSGIDNADELYLDNKGNTQFSSNHAGGILGGISNGDEVVVRMAIKPTSSILTARKTITKDGQETEIQTKGRHDPCVGIRAVPIAEAMMALTLVDHWLRFKAQCL